MAKNLIPEICKMLGVELGEEFEIKGYKGLAYKFVDDELIVCDDNNTETEYTTANMTLVGLLKGIREIVKLPWKPKMYEKYWTFDKLGQKWIAVCSSWEKCPYEILLFDKGWVFRTKEEAQAALPKVAEEMGVDYEL